jgi:hypothetical protein
VEAIERSILAGDSRQAQLLVRWLPEGNTRLLAFAEKEWRAGRDPAALRELLKSLPEDRRAPYRELLVRIKKERANGVPG